MNQISFQNNIIKLNIIKAPLIIRIIFFLFAFASFIFPILGMIISLTLGNNFNISFLIGIGFFSVLGFYLLRIALWNSYGEESIKRINNELIYEADYRWFRDGKKAIEIKNIKYSILPVGYEEDNNGILVLENGKNKIECSVKIPKQELEELIEKMKNNY
jgi:hypothetical protein